MSQSRIPKSIMDKCYRIKLGSGPIRIDLNPIVTAVSIVFIWGFIAWAIAEPKNALDILQGWQKWVTATWTWLYVGTQDCWAVFIIYLCFSKYKNMKLGKDDSKPEFSDVSYFTMLFAAGIGVGLFYFGVAEPMYHYRPGAWGNRYYHRYTDNQQAQDAINLTFFHWGIHGWIVYVLIGLLLGIISHRHDLPMTMKTCFYPLIGDRAFGLFGDIIDIISVVATMFGVCTSLGLGAVQFNRGINRLFGVEQKVTNQLIIIWAITTCATASVVSGLRVGIRRLSEICFALGMIIMFIAFFHDHTWYFLNVFTQSIGYYLQYLVQLGFHTDAFAQINNAPDGRDAENWMNEWTIFYWGWWIAWSPFVGMFVARISKGRTIREFVTFTLACPCIYIFLWFSIFGSIGINMEREAIAANITCDNDICGGKNATVSCDGLFRLSCRTTTDMWFDVILKYEGIGDFLAFLSLIGLVLYFVTSSDSGSLVIDCISANGMEEPPLIQRIFWALTEGACATALLYAGGQNALRAMQALNICSGLFYTMILNFMCIALWRQIRRDSGDEHPEIDPSFSTSLIDPLYRLPNKQELMLHLAAVFIPWWGGGKAAHILYGGTKKALIGYMLVLAVPFYIWLILILLWFLELIIGYGLPVGVVYIGWAVLMGFFAYLTGLRALMREKFSIIGNMAEDFFVCLLVYPLAVIQMEKHMLKHDPSKKNDPEKPWDRRTWPPPPSANVVPMNDLKQHHMNPAFQEEERDLKF